MKKSKILAMLLALVIVLTACSGGTGNSSDSGNKGGDKTITVYSPHPADTINPVVEMFEKATGVKVELVMAGTGELLKRIESESDNPLADVMWGGGAESLNSFKKYFEPYKSTEIDKLAPGSYDPEYYWLGESPLPMVIMYNTNLVPDGSQITSWKDVLKPEFKGKIAMADPQKSGSAYTILATMLTAYKSQNDGWDFIKDFYNALDGKVLSSSSGVYKGVSDGEYALGLTLEKEALPFVNAGAPVKIVYPSEGTSAVPDGVALVKNGKNQESAKLFIDYVLSKEAQDFKATLGRRPSRDDSNSPQGAGPLSDIKLVDYDFNWASSEKENILNKWRDIVIGQ